MARLVITGASLLGERTGDLYVDDAGLLVDEAPAGAEVLDADGLVALPGLVDLHTHLREPGREDAETILTGSRAAAVGGYTAVLAMANTSPVTDTAEAAAARPRPRSRGRPGRRAAGRRGHPRAGRRGARRARADGPLAGPGPGLLRRRQVRPRRPGDAAGAGVRQGVRRRRLPARPGPDPRRSRPSCCHEGELSGRLGLPGWPGIAEEVIVARDVMLARHTGSRVHVAHASTAGTVEVLRWAKSQGIDVTAEVTPHHLLLTTDLLAGYDPTYKVNPPLRPQEDVDALREALADGTIDAVATDHAPHARHDKEHAFVDAAFGMLGLETALAVVRTALPETARGRGVARVMSTDPGPHRRARRPRLARPRHPGPRDPGRPGRASVTVDRAASVSLSRNNPWHGRSLTSKVVHTVYAGRADRARRRPGLIGGPVTTVVLVIDVQRALVEPPHAVVDADGLVTAAGTPARTVPGAPACPSSTSRTTATRDPSIERGTPGWELVLPVLDGDVVVAKTGDDAFERDRSPRPPHRPTARTPSWWWASSRRCASSPRARAAQSRGFAVVLPRGGHATYDIPADPPEVPAVPAAHVARVVEWALGDQVGCRRSTTGWTVTIGRTERCRTSTRHAGVHWPTFGPSGRAAI